MVPLKLSRCYLQRIKPELSKSERRETDWVNRDYVHTVCVCARTNFGICICTSALMHVVMHVCCLSLCVSKIIKRPQKRVIPLLCVRVDCGGPEEERKC